MLTRFSSSSFRYRYCSCSCYGICQVSYKTLISQL